MIGKLKKKHFYVHISPASPISKVITIITFISLEFIKCFAQDLTSGIWKLQETSTEYKSQAFEINLQINTECQVRNDTHFS